MLVSTQCLEAYFANDYNDYNHYVQFVMDSLSKAYMQATKNVLSLQSQKKHCYDRKAHTTKLDVGDRELIRRLRFKEGPHKLGDVWDDGVYEVFAHPKDDFVYTRCAARR